MHHVLIVYMYIYCNDIYKITATTHLTLNPPIPIQPPTRGFPPAPCQSGPTSGCGEPGSFKNGSCAKQKGPVCLGAIQRWYPPTLSNLILGFHVNYSKVLGCPGQEVIGSMISKWVISSTYKWFVYWGDKTT